MRITSRGREFARIAATRLIPKKLEEVMQSQHHTRARFSAEAHTAMKRLSFTPIADLLQGAPEGPPCPVHEQVGRDRDCEVSQADEEIKEQKPHASRLDRHRHRERPPRIRVLS